MESDSEDEFLAGVDFEETLVCKMLQTSKPPRPGMFFLKILGVIVYRK